MKEILFNAGEGLVDDDLNDLQRRIRREVFDEMLYEMKFQHQGTPSGLQVVNPQALMATRVLATMNISMEAGTIFFSLATAADPDHDKVTHKVETAQVETLTDGTGIPGGEARIDLISCEVTRAEGSPESRDDKDGLTGALTTNPTTNKRRSTSMTLTVTEGTAGVTPSEPALPAGHLKICAVRVESGETTIQAERITDYRMPAGLANNAQYTMLDTTDGIVTEANTGDVYVPLFSNKFNVDGFHTSHQRLKKIIIRHQLDFTAGNISLVRRATSVSGYTYTLIENLVVNTGYGVTEAIEFNDNPVWTNGLRSAGLLSNIHFYDYRLFLKVDGALGIDDWLLPVVEYYGD